MSKEINKLVDTIIFSVKEEISKNDPEMANISKDKH